MNYRSPNMMCQLILRPRCMSLAGFVIFFFFSINKKTYVFYTIVNSNVLLSNYDVILECQISPQRIVIHSSSKRLTTLKIRWYMRRDPATRTPTKNTGDFRCFHFLENYICWMNNLIILHFTNNMECLEQHNVLHFDK